MTGFILDDCCSRSPGRGWFVGLLLLSLSLAFQEKLRGLVQICRREEGTGDSSPLPFPSPQCSV